MAFDEVKLVEEIYRFLRKWEGEFPTLPSDREIDHLKKQLEKLKASSRIEIQKLSDLSHHFHRSLTVRELFNLTVPFERALNKTIRDDEFLVSHEDKKTHEDKNPAYPLVLILENLRSAFNVGAIFRLSEALGVEKVILTGYTATPENEKVKKTTMGTESIQTWSWEASIEKVIQDLKSQGYQIISIETAQGAKSIEENFAIKPTAFIFGNERFGISHETLKHSDEIRLVPLSGNKNSLNVATCAAICAYEWIKQWKMKLK